MCQRSFNVFYYVLMSFKWLQLIMRSAHMISWFFWKFNQNLRTKPNLCTAYVVPQFWDLNPKYNLHTRKQRLHPSIVQKFCEVKVYPESVKLFSSVFQKIYHFNFVWCRMYKIKSTINLPIIYHCLNFEIFNQCYYFIDTFVTGRPKICT